MAQLPGVLLESAWRRIVLAHRPMTDGDPQGALPEGVTLDRWGGDAWLSHIGFDAVGPGPLAARVRGLAARVVRHRRLDTRTYVVGPYGPGVVLLESCVDRLTAALPRLLGLPYRHDRRLQVRVCETQITVRAGRTRLGGRPAPAPYGVAEPDTLEHFLLERYWIYGRSRRLGPWALRIAHEPWRVRPASVVEGDHGPAPLAHVARGVEPLRLVEGHWLGRPRGRLPATGPPLAAAPAGGLA